MQHEQKKAVQWEPWQSPVKTATTTVKIAKPINPNAVRTLLALQEQATRTGTPKSNAKSNGKSEPTKAAPPATRKRKWESESENEESEEPEGDEGEDEEEEDDSDASDEGVTQTTPAKGMKWSYVPYQAEEGQYLAARIVCRTSKEAELYCKGMTLALKKRKMREQQQKEHEARKARKAEAATEPAAPPAPAADQEKPKQQTDKVSEGAGAGGAAPDGAEPN